MKKLKESKKPLVHPNVVGKREIQQLYNAMKLIKTNPMPADERDRLNKLWKIGPYREWEINNKRIAEIEKEVHDRYSYLTGRRITTKTLGSGTGTGKKQLEIEYQKLLSEIENG